MDTADETYADDPRLDPALQALMAERSQLVGVAYRLLGSLSEAEDAVQEAYTRWCALPRGQRAGIASPGAWLTKVLGRICLDVLGSARARRERYVGEWIPEPVPSRAEWADGRLGASTSDPADRVTLDESITMAFLVLLESMTPAERVTFVLHDVFRYPFGEVADIVGRTPAACRQLATSARRRVRASRPPVASPSRHADLVRDFKQAWEAKDVGALVGLLDPDATTVADGGGLVSAVLDPIEGGERTAQVLVDIAGRIPDLELLERDVNGRPGLLVRSGPTTVAVVTFDVADDRIRRVWAVRNPEKLRVWA